MAAWDKLLAVLPLLPSLCCMFMLKSNATIGTLCCSIAISVVGYITTFKLIPIFAEYTLKRGISGKDLGKKGTELESKDVPEGLGVVTGITFLICTIVSQMLFAENDRQKVIFNSALFSICFMVLLGFMDDVVDLKWRYKLILPTVASLPLLMSYTGSTAMHLPPSLAALFMKNGQMTLLGSIANLLITVDSESNGEILELGALFMVFMGLQAVFCTNSINILAGINGVEAGQAYVIGASCLFFKMFDIVRADHAGENELFAVFLLFPFLATCLGLLQHNWYPSAVFVGDTFCYFAGMTFAVVGIHGHFSKTLLLLFIPQILNFVYSVPQLFRLVECPRHRLPSVDPRTGLLDYSRFKCRPDQYRWLKVKRDDDTCPNLTVLNLILRVCGPLREKTLCVVFLAFQVACSLLAVYIRYTVLEA